MRNPNYAIAAGTLCVIAAASVATGQPVWNIADHGAEPGRDVASVINEGLRTQHEHGLPVYIPHGRWGIGATIALPKRRGGALIGAGGSGGGAGDGLRGLGSILEWYGPADQPMMRMTGERWRVEHLTLRGVPFRGDRPRAAIGLLLTKTGRGLGAGKHDFRNLTIEECGVGIQCGLDPAEHNNDLLGYHRLVFDGCGVAYRVVNSQSMSHLIDRLEVRNTPVTFQFYGGGMLHARNVFAIDTTLLDIRRNDPPHLSPGANNAVFRIDNLKVDAGHAGRFQLLNSHEASTAQVILDCAMISGPKPLKLAKIGRGVRLVLRDVTSPTNAATVERLTGGELLLQNVRVAGLSED